MRKLGEFLLASPRNAIIAAFGVTFLPLIHLPGGFIAAIIVALVTLRKGAKAGAHVLAWVALPAISLLFLHRFGVFDVLLARCVLVWILAAILSRYASWRLVLEVTAMIGIAVIACLHLLIPDLHLWWAQVISSYINEVNSASAMKLSSAQINEFVKNFAPIATGLAAFIILLGSVVQLLIARWWQAYLFNPGQLRKEFSQIRMGQIAAIAIAVVVLGTYFNFNIAMNLLPVMLLPFLFAGLSLLHLLVGQNRRWLALMVVVYIGMVLLPFYVVLIVAFAGYIDSWLNLRVRLGTGTSISG